jgi:hypothetical protein
MQEVLRELEEKSLKAEKDKLQEAVAICAEKSKL